mgnify:FL=1|tara:strand:- start:177 stop:398 length:222 start_codon:yes stop_codon:yes gene_type:complete
MASDNDWYSDDSDETFYREKESRMWDEMGELNNDIIATWEFIKEKTREVKKMEEKYRDMEKDWNDYCEARANE